MSDENNATSSRPVAPAGLGRQPGLPKPPPHPLDGEWFMHLDGQVFGPFTGHQLRDFAGEGRISPETQVVRVGAELWVRAAEDGALAALFGRPAAPTPPPPGPLRAEAGAAVVQVTNHVSTAERRPAQVVILDPGVAEPKSAGTALILSILVVGLGQLYNGQIGKGIFMFFACILLWFVFLGWIIHLWSWIDAYKNAKAMNLRYLRNLSAGVLR